MQLYQASRADALTNQIPAQPPLEQLAAGDHTVLLLSQLADYRGRKLPRCNALGAYFASKALHRGW